MKTKDIDKMDPHKERCKNFLFGDRKNRCNYTGNFCTGYNGKNITIESMERCPLYQAEHGVLNLGSKLSIKYEHPEKMLKDISEAKEYFIEYREKKLEGERRELEYIKKLDI